MYASLTFYANTTMKQLSILCILCLIGIRASTQSSFVRRLTHTGNLNTYLPGRLAIGSDNSVSLLSFSLLSENLLLLGLSPEGELTENLRIKLVDDVAGWVPVLDYDRSGTQVHVFSARTRPPLQGVLFFLDRAQQNYWAKQINLASAVSGAVSCARNGDVVISHSYQVGNFQPLGLARLNQTGQLIWNTAYRYDGGSENFRGLQIHELANDELSVLGTASSNYANYLLNLTPDGDVIRSVGVLKDSIEFQVHSIDSEGNTYIGGRKEDSTDYFNGLILKLDADLRPIWSKKLVADRFSCIRLVLENLPNGNLAFSYTTLGDFPIIVGVISPEGELLQYQGYGLSFGQMKISQDNSFYLGTHGLSGSTLDFYSLIVKTDTQGNIEDCPQFAACIRLEDFELPLSPWSWTRHATPPLPDVALEVSEIPFEASPYCDTPVPPSAYFSMPDTLCQGTCAWPTELENDKAQQVEWRITGPGVDTLLVDSTFSWCFEAAGSYQISQEVWVLGCSEWHSHILEVLSDDLAPALGPDRLLCQSPPFELGAQSNRPLRSWLWDNGSTAPSISVGAGGLYHLQASDGYCSLHDSVQLSFITEVAPPPVFTGVSDTSVCRVLLPYRWEPQSPYTLSFSLNGAPEALPPFDLNEPGLYRIAAQISGCLLQDSMQLSLDPCPAPVYLPNAFSPNDDGVNDYCTPQGLHFEGIRLQVYDRWGGQLYESRQPPFQWDGRSARQAAPEGVYLLVFEYRNTRTGEQESLSAEVVLLR